ncbi:hypothetical protein EDB83DRAFT_2317967 [Lactarius deliciosus]|nr:hypothetical protein EDB83DRAFT_2317967 [Lactarius deliciosus]
MSLCSTWASSLSRKLTTTATPSWRARPVTRDRHGLAKPVWVMGMGHCTSSSGNSTPTRNRASSATAGPSPFLSQPFLFTPSSPPVYSPQRMRPQGASSDSESDPDSFNEDEDSMIYTAKHLGNGIAFRSRIFPRHFKSITTTPGQLGAGETETEANEPPHDDGDDLEATRTVTHGANEAAAAAAAGQRDNNNDSCGDYTDYGNDCDVTTMITTVMSMAAVTTAAAITGSQ